MSYSLLSLLNSFKNGMQHAYRFEENAEITLYDCIGNTNGTYVNGVTLYQPSPVGKSASFDGVNDHVTFGGNLGITSFPCSFTILFYCADITTSKVILGGTLVSDYKGITIIKTSAKILIRYGFGTGNTAASRKDFTTTVNCLSVGWNTITVNCESFNSITCYVNNNTPISTTVTAGTAASVDLANATYCLARYSSTYYSTLISELYIHNRLLTVDEIRMINLLFNSGIGLVQEKVNPPITSIEVYNKGVNGNNTSDVISRLTDINSVSANVAIIMIGLNDWRHPTGSKRRTPSQYETNLTTIVQNQKAQGRTVVLLNITPIEQTESDYVCPFYSLPTGCDSDATGEQFRAKILNVASSESVYYFDLKSEFDAVGQPNYTVDSYMENALNSASIDGLHFRPSGASFCAQKVYDYLVSINKHNLPYYICIGDSQTYGDGLTGGGTSTGQTYPAQLKILLNN